ncbi:hypothetical protein [Algicella marina]|uniref:Uncharacterized protein n=1 Tax=Algicella marina TaxID=2683284 RepID=A0A6P1T1X1_9RHOB|nr:hypothetical protein [Algicella marina]QHQ35977.1 hypothetical protein GO499_12750 [Algicella marina]
MHTRPEEEGQLEAPDDVRSAACSFGYWKTRSKHPLDCIESPSIAMATVLCRAVEGQNGLTSREIAKLKTALAREFGLDAESVARLLTLSHWLAAQGSSRAGAMSRMARNFAALPMTGFRAPLIRLFHEVATVIPDEDQELAVQSINLFLAEFAKERGGKKKMFVSNLASCTA